MKTGSEGISELDHASTHFHLLWILNLDVFGYLDDCLFFIKREFGLVFGVVGWVSLLIE